MGHCHAEIACCGYDSEEVKNADGTVNESNVNKAVIKV